MIQQNQRSVVENNNNKKPVVIHSCPLVLEFLLPPFHHLMSSYQAFNTIQLSSFLNILISQNWHKCRSSHVNLPGNACTSMQWEILSSVHSVSDVGLFKSSESSEVLFITSQEA